MTLSSGAGIWTGYYKGDPFGRLESQPHSQGAPKGRVRESPGNEVG